MRSLRSMCEKEWGDHWSFAAKAIGSLFAVFKAWRCNIMYGDWKAQVLKRSTLWESEPFGSGRPSLGLK